MTGAVEGNSSAHLEYIYVDRLDVQGWKGATKPILGNYQSILAPWVKPRVAGKNFVEIKGY
jgi:hypothetical protein